MLVGLVSLPPTAAVTAIRALCAHKSLLELEAALAGDNQVYATAEVRKQSSAENTPTFLEFEELVDDCEGKAFRHAAPPPLRLALPPSVPDLPLVTGCDGEICLVVSPEIWGKL
jgi:hypothetical protein